MLPVADDRVGPVEGGDETHDLPHVELVVAVGEEDVVVARGGEPAAHGGPVAAIRPMMDGADARVASRPVASSLPSSTTTSSHSSATAGRMESNAAAIGTRFSSSLWAGKKADRLDRRTAGAASGASAGEIM